MLRKYFVSNIAFMNSTRSEGGQTIALNTIEKLYGSINALLGDTKTYSFFYYKDTKTYYQQAITFHILCKFEL